MCTLPRTASTCTDVVSHAGKGKERRYIEKERQHFRSRRSAFSGFGTKEMDVKQKKRDLMEEGDWMRYVKVKYCTTLRGLYLTVPERTPERKERSGRTATTTPGTRPPGTLLRIGSPQTRKDAHALTISSFSCLLSFLSFLVFLRGSAWTQRR